MSKVLLVTGASSDVGSALIRRVQGNYDTVIAHYSRSDEVVIGLRNEFGAKIVPAQADFSDEASTFEFVKKITKSSCAVEHYVHLAAGLPKIDKFSKISWEDFEREFNISFRAGTVVSSAILPYMAKKKRGRVIFMLSFYTVNQPPMQLAAAYNATKYALLGLMRNLSAEYISKGITVNGVSPSMIDTRYIEGIHELLIRKNADESPLKRNLRVDDVVPLFEFLLSDGAGCITGQNIAVTGGN
jgi:3-oxoacyl-[acyl-carrier protein] reductase